MIQAPVLPPAPSGVVKWRVILHQQSDKYFLDILELPSSPSASDIVNELRTQYLARDLGMPRLRRLVRVLLFRKPIYGKGSLAPMLLDSNTFKCFPCQVIVSHCEEDVVLNQAFGRPTLLGRSDSFLRRYSMFEFGDGLSDTGTSCLMMTYGLDKSRLAAAMFVVTVLCLSVGLLAGLLSKRMDMGFLFCGGAMSLLTSAQVTIFWVFG